MPWHIGTCDSEMIEDDPSVSKPRVSAKSLQKYKVCFELEEKNGTILHSSKTFVEETDGWALAAARKWIAAKKKRDAIRFRDVRLHRLTTFVRRDVVVAKIEEVEVPA